MKASRESKANRPILTNAAKFALMVDSELDKSMQTMRESNSVESEREQRASHGEGDSSTSVILPPNNVRAVCCRLLLLARDEFGAHFSARFFENELFAF